MTFYLSGSAGTVAQDGINLWYNQPAAVYYSGSNARTYFAYTNSQTQIVVRYFDHATNTYGQETVVADLNVRPDDHFSAAIEVIQSGPNQGHILLAYAYHATPMTVMMSAAAEDTSSFAQVAYLPDRTTYPSFVSSGDGYRLFYRETTGAPGQLQTAYTSVLIGESGAQTAAPVRAFDPGPGWFVYGFPPVERDGEIFLSYFYYPSSGPATAARFGYSISIDGGATWSARNGTSASLGLNDIVNFDAPASSRIIDVARVDGEWLVSLTEYAAEGSVGALAAGRIIRISDGAVLFERPVAVNYYADGIVFDDANPRYVYYSTPSSAPQGAGQLMMTGFSSGLSEALFTIPFALGTDLHAIRPGSIANAAAPGALTWIDVTRYSRWFDFSTSLAASPSGVALTDRSADSSPLTATFGQLFSAAGAAPSVLIATRFGDRVTGSASQDVIAGLDGDDILSGGAAPDRLLGGRGNDILAGGSGADVLDGGDGAADEARYASSGSRVVIDLTDPSGQTNAGDAQGDTFVAVERFRLSVHGDAFLGSNATGAVNWASGEGGDDVFTSGGAGTVNIFAGGSGGDIFWGGAGEDQFRGGAGADAMNGGANRDWLYGDADADTLDGGTGNDTMSGGAGDDTVTGGAGDDVMSGGTGADRFVFQAPTEGRDAIRDFAAGIDFIAVARAGFGIETLVLRAGPNPAAEGEGGQFLYNTANGRLSFDADGAGPGAAIWFATLTGRPALTSLDFELA